MKKFFVFAIVVAMSSASLGFLTAHAVGLSVSGSLPGMTANPANPGSYIQSFYALALMLGGVLAFGAVVYGGILYAASAGNSSKQSEGKEWIFSALTGLLLLAGAWLVLNTINPDLTNVAFPSLSNLSATTANTANSNPTGIVFCQGTTQGQCADSSQVCSCTSGTCSCQSQSALCAGTTYGPCPQKQTCVNNGTATQANYQCSM